MDLLKLFRRKKSRESDSQKQSVENLEKMAEGFRELRRIIEEAEEANAMKDLRVTLKSTDDSSRDYSYSVENVGNKKIEQIKIYPSGILGMGNFGVDDTYMRNSSPDSPIEIEALMPGDREHIACQGYSSPSRYVGKRKNIRKIEYVADGVQYGLDGRQTVLVCVELASAR